MPALWIGAATTLGSAALQSGGGKGGGAPSMRSLDAPSMSAFDSSNWAVNVGSGSQTNRLSSSTDAGGQSPISGMQLGQKQILIALLIVGVVWYATKK